MNRETPELDHGGFFYCRDCHHGTLFGFNIDAKLMTFFVYCDAFSEEVLSRVATMYGGMPSGTSLGTHITFQTYFFGILEKK